MASEVTLLASLIAEALEGHAAAHAKLMEIDQKEAGLPTVLMNLLAAYPLTNAQNVPARFFASTMLLRQAQKGRLGPPGPLWNAVLAEVRGRGWGGCCYGAGGCSSLG